MLNNCFVSTLAGISKLYYRITDRVMDAALGVRTVGDSDNDPDPDTKRYQPTPYVVLRRIMKYFQNPSSRGGFLDIGTGKGRALVLAKKYGFRNINGIEKLPELVETARRNISAFDPYNAVKIINSDVLDLKLPPETDVFFLFNPFSDSILEQFMKNILLPHTETVDNPLIIYVNPIWRRTIKKYGFRHFHTIGSFNPNYRVFFFEKELR